MATPDEPDKPPTRTQRPRGKQPFRKGFLTSLGARNRRRREGVETLGRIMSRLAVQCNINLSLLVTDQEGQCLSAVSTEEWHRAFVNDMAGRIKLEMVRRQMDQDQGGDDDDYDTDDSSYSSLDSQEQRAIDSQWATLSSSDQIAQRLTIVRSESVPAGSMFRKPLIPPPPQEDAPGSPLFNVLLDDVALPDVTPAAADHQKRELDMGYDDDRPPNKKRIQ